MRKTLTTQALNLTEEITKTLEKRVKAYHIVPKMERIGKVIAVGDGIATIQGLDDIAYAEMVEFKNNVFGLAVNLNKDSVGVIVFGDYTTIKEGDEVRGTSRLMSVLVGEELLGRVVNPLGQPLDGKGEVKTKEYVPLEKIAPGVIERQPVDTPLQTGIKAIDSMVPIGRGQRELIIGDRGTGKTAIALDTIINQRQGDVVCIYVGIGQKQVRIAQVIDQLTQRGSMDHTIIVSASASDSASLQFIAPYAGCAIGEYFMSKGKDALVIYDDLSKHAWAYRQTSLILRRPSGREAYPGDIFYLHSRLLERACRLNKNLGGGSLTALPIVETQAGDISAYIPTNIISITDGQIYLESDLFNAGIRPAISVGLSVSRVGGSAQIKAMKQVAGPLRLDLAQYRELAAFVQFASDLDPATRAKIERGARMIEILKQKQFAPHPIEDQVVIFWAASNGYIDDVAVTDVQNFELDYLKYMKDHHKELMKQIVQEKKITEELGTKLKKATESFKEKKD